MSATRVYESPSGDTWDVLTGEDGDRALVRHTPNRASGGKASDIGLDAFLRLSPHSPENRAVVAHLDQWAKPLRGYVHDPKEKGAPYIAVVLDANDEPTISLHKSYAEAERDLEGQLAGQKQVTLAHRSRDD